jgi:DNA-binding IclR family transcriptional regulator
MACINPDGTLTPSAHKVLFALRVPGTQSDVAELTSMPMYRVRVSLRELIEAGFLEEKNGGYQATEKGIAQI